MAEARFNQVGVDVEAAVDGLAYGLRATGQTLIFDGFIRVYQEGRDEGPDEDAEARLPELTVEQALRMIDVLPEQHFTQPRPGTPRPPSSVLEELEIGRPSTYASIISTIQDRGLRPPAGQALLPRGRRRGRDDKLVEHFPEIVNVNFTAKMEEELDRIADRPASAYSASSGSRSGRTSSARRRSSSATSRRSTRTAHGASRRAGRPRAASRSAWADTGDSSVARATHLRTAGAGTSGT